MSNCAAFVFVCATNGLAGGSVGKVSNNYANHIVPDGWAFSIWGIIYTFLFGFLVYQAKCVECQAVPAAAFQGMLLTYAVIPGAGHRAPPMSSTASAGCGWTAVVISSALILALLCYNLLICWKTGAWQPADAPNRTWSDIFLVDVPFSHLLRLGHRGVDCQHRGGGRLLRVGGRELPFHGGGMGGGDDRGSRRCEPRGERFSCTFLPFPLRFLSTLVHFY